MSSAYISAFACRMQLSESSIQMMNKSGPRQDPCGIPHVIKISLDFWFPKEQCGLLLVRYDSY